LRLGDQQMKVLGHDHVPEYDELIAAPHLLENGEEQVTTSRGAEQRFTPITTAGDEVRIVVTVIPLQIPRHDNQSTGVGIVSAVMCTH
jgi:hypothetical protein